MSYQYDITDTSGFGTAWRDRSHTDRKIENEMQRAQIGNIESFLTGVDWDSFKQQDIDLSGYGKQSDIDLLKGWNEDRIKSIDTLSGGLGTAQSDIKTLQDRLANWDTTTDIGDVTGLEDRLGTLKEEYESNIDEYRLGQETFESRMTQNLAGLEDTLRGDWAADIKSLDLDNVNRLIETNQGDLSKVKQDFSGLSANVDQLGTDLRKEYSDSLTNLTQTFDDKYDALESTTGDSLSKLFGETATLQDEFTTQSEQLQSFQDQFKDYKTDAATNLSNVEAAFSKQLGDQSTDWTNKLSDLQSSTASDILGLSTKTAEDIEGARAEAASGLSGLRTDIASDLEGLEEGWSDQLKAQGDAHQKLLDERDASLNKRLSDISSSMNYRMLGDSAEGVKIRRSRAYNTGRTRSGTGQLNRSMKINTLNI